MKNNKTQILHPQSRVERPYFATLAQSRTVYEKLTKNYDNTLDNTLVILTY